MEIIGHRGARGLAEENTVKSIRRALAAKVDMIEIDIRVQNGELVLSHNPITIEDRYETLSDVLSFLHGRKPLNIEIKELACVDLLPAVLKKYTGKILLSSFEYRILQRAKELFPDTELAVLEKWSGVRAIAEATMLGTKRVHINQQWVWSGFVKSMKNQGYSLYAYTVNSRDRAEELESWGVDGIFTDYPTLFEM